MSRQQENLDSFLRIAQDMDIDPLELDRFFHSFYQTSGDLTENLELLNLFLYGRI
tara:strand:- start:1524 stop:1688 length:165 start_codon:yes stop_codon:yes gene_type:complete